MLKEMSGFLKEIKIKKMYNYAIGNFDELVRQQRDYFAATADVATATPAPALSTSSSEVAPAVLSPTISSPPRSLTVDSGASTTVSPSSLQVSTAPVATKVTTSSVSTPRYVPPAYAKPIEDGGVDVNAQIASGMRSGGGGGGSAPAEEFSGEVKKNKSFLIWGLLLAAGIGAYIKYS